MNISEMDDSTIDDKVRIAQENIILLRKETALLMKKAVKQDYKNAVQNMEMANVNVPKQEIMVPEFQKLPEIVERKHNVAELTRKANDALQCFKYLQNNNDFNL